jgi:hypothetical protein
MAFAPRLKDDGTPCCFRPTEDGRMAYPADACGPCKEFAASRYRAACERETAFRTTEDTMKNDLGRFAPPNGYQRDIEMLRTARHHQEPENGEAQFKRMRTEQLAAEAAAIDPNGPLPGSFDRLSRLRTGETIPTPNPYEKDIKARQQEMPR